MMCSLPLDITYTPTLAAESRKACWGYRHFFFFFQRLKLDSREKINPRLASANQEQGKADAEGRLLRYFSFTCQKKSQTPDIPHASAAEEEQMT